MRRLFAITTATFVLTSLAFAADDAPKPVELTIHARAIEEPVLKYHLLPPESELKEGNAAPILLRIIWEQRPYMTNVFPKIYDWINKPISADDWKEFPQVLPDRFYSEMKRAAFRRTASWEYPIGETAAYSILLPDVQGLRAFLGHGLPGKVGYHISRGEVHQAREVILVGFANARHIAETPFLVNQSVANAIGKSLLHRTAELISQPNSPNLYWALSALPGQLLQEKRAANLEADMFGMSLPFNELDRPRAAKEWKELADQLADFIKHESAVLSLQSKKFHVTELIDVVHARAELKNLAALTPDQFAAMSDEEAAVRFYALMRTRIAQKSSAIFVLPAREAWPQLTKLQAEHADFVERTTSARDVMFEPGRLFVSFRSLDRSVNALRIIEAVRNHLATHDNKLPATLDEITEVPIPLDPVTDKPFVWSVDGDVATLTSPPPPEGFDDLADLFKGAATNYRLTVAK